jgi:hypothetical protein
MCVRERDRVWSVSVCMCVREIVCDLWVCVYVWEREIVRDLWKCVWSVSECVCELERNRERVCVCVCVDLRYFISYLPLFFRTCKMMITKNWQKMLTSSQEKNLNFSWVVTKFNLKESLSGETNFCGIELKWWRTFFGPTYHLLRLTFES